MVRLLAGSVIVSIFLSAGWGWADPAPAAVPARAGVAPAGAAAPAGPVDVAVEPFQQLGAAAAPAWIGSAVQQNLISDLARMRWHPQASEAAPPSTQPGAAGARFLVRGTYQTTGEAIRIDGQVVDASGRVVGGLSATGPLRDLFGLEDAVSAQAVHQLRALASPAAATAPMTADALAQAVQPPSAAPTGVDGYDGSVLQAYVDSNSAPSNDYIDQVNASRIRQTYAADYSTGLSPFGWLGYPGAFYGTSFYPIGFGFLPYGYGGYGLGYGRFGYGRFGYGGFGGARLGRGTFFGSGGNYGYGFGGGGAAFHGGGFGR